MEIIRRQRVVKGEYEMLLKNLHIINFKMFEDLNLQFKPGFNLILGDNGVGKTSVLEAATVAVSGFLTGMEDIPTRNIYKDDIHYNILVNNMELLIDHIAIL